MRGGGNSNFHNLWLQILCKNIRCIPILINIEGVISVKHNLPNLLPSSDNFHSIVNGRKISLLYIRNKNGLCAAITNYGARMVGLLVPDKSGSLKDIVLGFDNCKSYLSAEEKYFGAVVGRFGGRIAHGKLILDGITCQLDINNNSHSLHGGTGGFHSVVWDMQQVNDATIQLNYTSADGEEGYPGTLTVTVTYSLTDDDALVMHFEVSTDKKTVRNIFNHNFWNLNGEGSGSVAQHQLMIDASHFLAVDASLIPVGMEAVGNTPFDFSAFHEIGERIHEHHEQLLYGNGYDHNYVLNKGVTEQPQLVASVIGDQSGIRMDILTTEPGLQLYSCNFLKGLHQLKCGAKDEFRSAVCLETQHFPDSPNQASFPSVILDAGRTYRSETIHKFSRTM